MRIDRICNFTNAFLHFNLFTQDGAEILDFTDLRGTTGYCSDESAERIRKKLQKYDPGGTHYIDDGNHHYLTLFWLERIKEPFDLVVLDHHTDLQRPALLPVLSCGGWIRTALDELEFLQHVYLIGPPAEDFEKEKADYPERIVFLDEQEANTGSLIVPDERPFYISVDLDILSEKEFHSVWDQGSMNIKRLLLWLEALQKSEKVIGTDLCG